MAIIRLYMDSIMIDLRNVPGILTAPFAISAFFCFSILVLITFLLLGSNAAGALLEWGLDK